jgi:type I restriction-modification system DNA methylase subunit
MNAPQELLDLVDRFDQHHEAYRTSSYNEAQVRREFIDPIFSLLGWDISNRQGYAEAYKDVIHEDAIKIGGATKAPDYCFRVGGTRKFFLEAKKPSINIKEDASPAFQLRRYAWSAKLPLSILTNFEAFAIYDCRTKPDKTDKPSTSRTLYFPYTQYRERWQEIADIFSRDAVLKGSFDKYAESTKTKKGTAEVERVFLQDIEHWREILARNIARRNPRVSQRELNLVVQSTIDRIIFLRICEDRGIEEYGCLQALQSGSHVYERLGDLFLSADERYNSGLFHFRKEKGHFGPHDELSLGLTIDDDLLKNILKGLYYPDSPYEFSVLPADILGQIYEQFLGKVIRLTTGHIAVVEDKPEVKKSGGIYYTPTYIVDYIVSHTVGELLKGKTPRQVVNLRILDPACGSGSFLINAYQYLLDWYRDYYVNDGPRKHTKELYQGLGGNWQLATAVRKRILLNCIYGLDIDPQAVEVTKLSLLLKVLEGENQQTLMAQLKLFHERALPDLGSNIKCGNSLIAPDFYNNCQLNLMNQAEHYRINVFDWKDGFPAILTAENSGFNAVIGNPPYVDIKALPDNDVQYIFQTYPSANSRINLFAAFIEKSLDLVNSLYFRFSMIVPTALLTQDSYRALRHKIINNYQIKSIARLPNESFGAAAGDVKVDTAIIVLQQRDLSKIPIEIISYSGYDRVTKIESSTAQSHSFVSREIWADSNDSVWSINTDDADAAILQKCELNSVPLEECVEICLGLTPYDKYKGHTTSQITNRVFHADFQKDRTFKRLLAGNDVMRYALR